LSWFFCDEHAKSVYFSKITNKYYYSTSFK